jgi:hypothetical protein
MSIFDEMNSRDLEALAVKLHTQINRIGEHSELPKLELEDVKRWIALHRKESKYCFELSSVLSLL